MQKYAPLLILAVLLAAIGISHIALEIHERSREAQFQQTHSGPAQNGLAGLRVP